MDKSIVSANQIMPFGVLATTGAARLLGTGYSQGVEWTLGDADYITPTVSGRTWLLVQGGKLPISGFAQWRLANGADLSLFVIEWQGLYYVGVHKNGLPYNAAVEVWGPFETTDGIAEQVLREYAR